MIDDDTILDILRRRPARHKICLIEACKSQVVAMGESPWAARIEQFNVNCAKIPPGLVFITSTTVGSESYGYPDRGGVLSHYMLEGLKG